MEKAKRFRIVSGNYAILKVGSVVSEEEIFQDFCASASNLSQWENWFEGIRKHLEEIA